MYIPDNYTCKLRFCIEKWATKKYKEKWINKLKKICDGGSENNKYISKLMLSKCSLDSNKNLPILNRSEGGIGGNDNLTNKQIRYQDSIMDELKEDYNENDIKLNILNSNVEKWTLEELDDILKAYTKVFNEYMCEKCTIGTIELVNNNLLYESDSD